MLNPQAEHLLDWFHITMQITVMTNMTNMTNMANMAKTLRSPPPDPERLPAPPPDLAADVAASCTA